MRCCGALARFSHRVLVAGTREVGSRASASSRAVLGVVVYGVVRDHWDSKTAMLSQTPQLLLGLLFLSMVRLPKNAPPPPAE